MRFIIIFLVNLGLILGYSFNLCCQTNYEQGVKEYLTGDLHKSIEYFNEAIIHNDNIANSYMYRGAARGFIGDFDKAYQDLELSKKEDSENYKVYYYLGMVCFLDNKHTLAIDHFNRSNQLYDQDPDIYDNRALAKIKIGDAQG